jgi:hypothetical protein
MQHPSAPPATRWRLPVASLSHHICGPSRLWRAAFGGTACSFGSAPGRHCHLYAYLHSEQLAVSALDVQRHTNGPAFQDKQACSMHYAAAAHMRVPVLPQSMTRM